MAENQQLRMSEDSEGKHPADVLLKIRTAQITQLYRQTIGGLFGVLVVAILATVILWEVIPHLKLEVWLVSMLLITAIRGGLTFFFQRKAPTGHAITPWAHLHAVFSALSALAWGAPSFLLWPVNDPIHQLVWPICIVSISAAAVLMYCTWKPSFLPFVFFASLPISFRLLTGGDLPYVVLGILGLIFSFLLAYSGLLMHHVTVNAFAVSIQNESLNGVLSREKGIIQELNDQLHEEVAQRKQSQDELQDKNEKLEKLNAQLTATKENLESANQELADALADVKKLSGMLPICSSCKKIRNDSGYWEQIEAYIFEHSGVEFSHGICPDCFKKIYPDFTLDENDQPGS